MRSKNYSIRINNCIQVSNAELAAILEALIVVFDSDHADVVVFAGSEGGCRALSRGGFEDYLVHAMWEIVNNQAHRRIAVQWIPGHCNILGNEQADEGPKVACYDDDPLLIPITFSDALCVAKLEAFKQWQIECASLSRTKGNHH